MPRDTSNQLVEFALNEVGGKLRTVAVLYQDDCEVIYLRDNLQDKYTPSEYKRVADSFRVELGIKNYDDQSSPLGAKHSVIHYHEDCFVFQFPHENCHSILLSVETDVGSRLQSFISACEERIK